MRLISYFDFEGGRENEKSWNCSGFEFNHSRSGTDLQWKDSARDLLVDHYAGILDRHWRPAGLGLSHHRRMDGIQLREREPLSHIPDAILKSFR